MKEKIIKWIEPLKLAQKIASNYQEKDWVFLYSGLNENIKNSHSYICLFKQKNLICDDFSKIEKTIKNDNDRWFGYLSYELGQEFEKLPKGEKSIINLPKIHLINFGLIFEFNHDKKILKVKFLKEENLDEVLKYKASRKVLLDNKVKNISSNFSDKSYLKAIINVKEMIAKGDFYQTNLTRKFFGKFTKTNNQKENFELFLKLAKISPANYSSFLKLNDNYIISSSPELFLKIDEEKNITSRPIKGTAPRGKNLQEDLQNKLNLQNNPKEKAENLMIVDLVRNDLSRICQVNSVKVKKLFDITSYKTIHHMSSDVFGKISDDFSNFDAIKSCFPAGSMTGAPKIKAMEFAAQKEKINRGIYSGAIGFLSKDQVNLSVVIRTLIIRKKTFEFQVGGAITFDSDENLELDEIFNKAIGIMKLLKINSTLLEPLK